MPAIRKSADLRNSYNKISEFCHKYREPVFITKNGEGDLAVMSIETYEELAGKNELYALIQEGIDDIEHGRTLTEKEVLENMDKALHT
jgi:prevent-host-death family protein